MDDTCDHGLAQKIAEGKTSYLIRVELESKIYDTKK